MFGKMIYWEVAFMLKSLLVLDSGQHVVAVTRWAVPESVGVKIGAIGAKPFISIRRFEHVGGVFPGLL